MKVFILFSVLIAGALAQWDRPNTIQANQYDENQSPDPNAKQQQIALTPEILDVLVRQQQQQEQQDGGESGNAPQAKPFLFWDFHYGRDRFSQKPQQGEQQAEQSESNNGSPSSSLGFWATYPDAAPFDAKIRSRLDSSRALANKQDVRQKLMEIAEQKFNQCKGKVDHEERACLGRSTGQVMQLVSAVENMSRNQQSQQ